MIRVVVAVVVVAACVACAPAPRAPTANQAPIPVLDAPLTARVGVPIHVDGSSSSDVDGAVSDAFILFGDGGDPVIGFEADHTFARAGLFLVELYIDDDKGATARARVRVTVTE